MNATILTLSRLQLILASLSLALGLGNTHAATLIKPIAVTQLAGDEAVDQGRVAANLVTDNGLSETPTSENFASVTQGGGHYRSQSTAGPNYFAGGGTPPVFEFSLDGTYLLGSLVVWGFVNNGDEGTDFMVEFSADNGATYPDLVAVASPELLGYKSGELSFGASYKANKVRLTITDNAQNRGFPNEGGGDHVACGKVRFLGTPTAGPSVPPGITAQPVSQHLLAGADATLSVTAGGTAPLSYQWLFQGTNLTDANAISGSQTATLTIQNVQPIHAGPYSVVVTNTAGSVTSIVAEITVFTPPPPEVVFIKPIAVTLLAGDEATDQGRVAANLVTDAGLSGTPTTTNYPFITQGGGHYRSQSTAGPNYFAGGGTPPVFEFSLDGTYLLGSLVVWGFVNNGDEGTDFMVEFSADNGAAYPDLAVVASPKLLGYQSGELPFGASYLANKVRLTITDNARNRGFPNDGGGDHVACGKVRFLGKTLVLSAQRHGQELIISWPPEFTGYTLESTDRLPASAWSPVAGVVNNQVTISIGSGQAYYRLRQ